VLLLAMPPAEELLELSARLTHGLIAVLVSQEEVYEGRRVAAGVDNIIFSPTDPDGNVPWRDGFFTIIWPK
jgi:hypothetical protein